MKGLHIIGGRWRGRRIESPAGLDTRPTLGRVREALFNILGAEIEGAHFADLYAGSGAVGLEALSRGARRATFVESARPAAAAIRANLAGLGAAREEFALFECGVERAAGRLEATGPGNAAPIDVLFADPPYVKQAEAAVAPEFVRFVEAAPLAPGALVVIQAPPDAALPPIEGWRLDDARKYGRSALHFLRRADA